MGIWVARRAEFIKAWCVGLTADKVPMADEALRRMMHEFAAEQLLALRKDLRSKVLDLVGEWYPEDQLVPTRPSSNSQKEPKP